MIAASTLDRRSVCPQDFPFYITITHEKRLEPNLGYPESLRRSDGVCWTAAYLSWADESSLEENSQVSIHTSFLLSVDMHLEKKRFALTLYILPEGTMSNLKDVMNI